MQKPQDYRVEQHRAAPEKPPTGEPCNGCGLCCLVEPCPVGMALTRRLRGSCALLRWEASMGRYLCGALPRQEQDMTRDEEQKGWAQNWRRRIVYALVYRWISAGSGCDAHLRVE